MSEHLVSVDSLPDSARPGPDQAYAAFCDSPDCLWRGDWHHADEYATDELDGDSAAYDAADSDAHEHRLDTRGTGGPVVHVPTVLLSKTPVDGKRPGDTFTRQGITYRVVRIHLANGTTPRVTTVSEFGRETWF